MSAWSYSPYCKEPIKTRQHTKTPFLLHRVYPMHVSKKIPSLIHASREKLHIRTGTPSSQLASTELALLTVLLHVIHRKHVSQERLPLLCELHASMPKYCRDTPEHLSICNERRLSWLSHDYAYTKSHYGTHCSQCKRRVEDMAG